MFNSDRPIMRPTDIDELFKRFKACMHSRDVLYGIAIGNDNTSDVQQAVRAYDRAQTNLMTHILAVDIEFLDLLDRGRSDNSIRQYERDNKGRTVPHESKEE